MKSNSFLRISFSVVTVMFFSATVFAQRVIPIASGFGTIGNTILGDTTSTGERVDTNTVYTLERGGLYILDGEFAPTTRVNLRAVEGTGPRPKIILGVPSGGTTPDQVLRPKANIFLKSIYITAKDEFDGLSLRIVRAQENGIKISLDDCVLDIASQAAFRIDTKNIKIIMKNSIVSNIGLMSSPDNGRVFDDRGNNIDTLIVINNTFYNITSKVIRDAGGSINYAMFDHNTMINIGQLGCEIGAVNDVVFTNNVMVNPAFIGTPNTPVSALTLKVPTDTTVIQKADVRNNNIYTEAALIAAYPDTIKAPVSFDDLTQSIIAANGWENTNIEETLTFAKAPVTPVNTVTTYWQDPTATQVELDTVGHLDFDFQYNTSANSYTAGSSGQPLGALTWFDMTVGVEEETTQTIPNEYELFQNYPNPFNPETRINYSLPQQTNVTLIVFNLLGQEIATLVNAVQSAGTHSVNWNGFNNFGQKVSSGIYLYRLTAGNFVSVKKMSFLK